jgi:hypothetical protein
MSSSRAYGGAPETGDLCEGRRWGHAQALLGVVWGLVRSFLQESSNWLQLVYRAFLYDFQHRSSTWNHQHAQPHWCGIRASPAPHAIRSYTEERDAPVNRCQRASVRESAASGASTASM